MKKLDELTEDYYPSDMIGGGISKHDRQLQQNAFKKGYKSNSENLRALLEGLEMQNIDMFLEKAKVGDYRNYGKAYSDACKEKLKSKDEKIEEMIRFYDLKIIGLEIMLLESPDEKTALRDNTEKVCSEHFINDLKTLIE